jgi:pimeloyl-ACP methyl ester carboxylesterase
LNPAEDSKGNRPYEVTGPPAFLAGRPDAILRMSPGVDIVELMRAQFDDLRYVKLLEDTGHWLQQERPAEVNAALLEFLATSVVGPSPMNCST